MANQEQVDRLLQGVKNWNIWRKKHPTDTIDLTGANLFLANLRNVKLTSADLTGAKFNDACLIEADLTGTDLSFAQLNGSHCKDINLSDANLNSADLRDTILIGAKLTNVNLGGANFTGADLTNADLTKTRVAFTIFGDNDLRTVKGLETVFHEYPSTIGADTILRSEGDIPEVFLRGVGLSDTFIEYARSLAQHPIEYYTCFISYSSQDKAFANRLYADLQNNNVRCWFAP